MRCEFGSLSDKHCQKEATHTGFYAGCPYCGGGDCTSYAEHWYYCAEHADADDIPIEGDLEKAVVQAEIREYLSYKNDLADNPSGSYARAMLDHWAWATPEGEDEATAIPDAD